MSGCSPLYPLFFCHAACLSYPLSILNAKIDATPHICNRIKYVRIYAAFTVSFDSFASKNKKAMKTNNPFADLGIEINPKSLFESFSYESSKISEEERINLFAKIVIAGYDLNLTVKQYLIDKSATNDKNRIEHIKSTIKNCTDDLLEWYLTFATDLDLIKPLLNKVEQIDEGKSARLKDVIDLFVEAAQLIFTTKGLLLRYIEKDTQKYNRFSFVLNIDLEQDISERLNVKDAANERTNHWSYSALYEWYKLAFLPSLLSNHVVYWEPSFEMPAAQIANIFIKKYLPIEEHELLKGNADALKERLLEMNAKIISILWLDKPLVDEPIYLVRCNYTGNAACEVEKLYKENIISICIQKHEQEDQAYYDSLINEENPTYNKSLLYIHRFVSLTKLARTSDVISFASYIGYNPKIGLIKRGSTPFVVEREEYKLYCIKMMSVYSTPAWGEQMESIDLRAYPLLKSIIPQQITISAVNQRRSTIYSIYYGLEYPVNLSSMSNEAIEIMCSEWLRSKYVPQSYRIMYQLLKTGGNLSDIDIIGINDGDEKVVAQVSNTNDINLITRKIKKLNLVPADYRVMFSMEKRLDLEYILGCKNVFIENVWNDFFSDDQYRKMLKRLICY